MPDSATRYAVDNDDKMNDEVDGDENSPVSLAETKANAAELASWDGFLPSDDIAHHHHRRKSLSNQRSVDKEDGDNYDDDDTFIISQPTLRRRRRRSSTLFSRSSKSLLQDAETNLVNAEHNEPSDSEDEDEETVESYLPPLIPNPSNSMDPVDSLVLSDLTVHSPTLVEKPAASSVADVDSTDILVRSRHQALLFGKAPAFLVCLIDISFPQSSHRQRTMSTRAWKSIPPRPRWTMMLQSTPAQLMQKIKRYVIYGVAFVIGVHWFAYFV